MEKPQRRLASKKTKTKAKVGGVLKTPTPELTNMPQRRQVNRNGKTRPGMEQDLKLFELFAELRNSIYELVLLEKERVQVRSSGESQLRIPALLVVCSQIRNETSSIWYKSNEFTINVFDCDATVLNAWTARCCNVGQREYDSSISLAAVGHWQNIVHTCCYAVWNGDKSRKLTKVDGMSDYEQTVCSAHAIVERNKGKSWKRCLEELKNLRGDVTMKNRKWLDYSDSDDSDGEY